jgi:hypothetical protein
VVPAATFSAPDTYYDERLLTACSYCQAVTEVDRISWLGHLVRMEGNSHCKKVTFFQPEGSQKKERPKLR